MSFVPRDFVPPVGWKTDRFFLRGLTIRDLSRDYEAVTSSREYLQKTCPVDPAWNWPPKDLSLEQDLIDLGWHQKEFQIKSSFAYTVLSLDEQRCLGCVYIFPSDKKDFDAKITMWVRQSEVSKGLDMYLFESIKSWIEADWPFKKPSYPAREISWTDWEQFDN